MASVETPAGTIALRHPDAAAIPATTTKNKATYPRALPGGRDLVVSLTGEGFEESVGRPARSPPG